MNRLVVILLLVIFNIVCSNAQVIVDPIFDRCDTPSFRIEKVKISKDTTYVFCVYSAAAGTWASLSHNTYLRADETKKIYPLLKCEGLPYSPLKKSFIYDERCNILLCFPSISGITKFDIIEDENEKDFNIYGIDISKQYESSYLESQVKRFANLSSFYDSSGDTIKALQFKEYEIEASKYIFGIRSEQFLVKLFEESILYDKYEKYEQAIWLAEQSEGIYAESWGTKDLNYAHILDELAKMYFQAGNYKKSIESYIKVIDLFELFNKYDDDYALAFFFLSYNYKQIGDYENAIYFQNKCIKMRRQLGNANHYIDELRNLLYLNVNHKKEIIIVETELADLPIYVSDNSMQIAEIHNMIASKYSLLEDHEKALEYCNKSLDIYRNNNIEYGKEYAELLSQKCNFQQRSGLNYEAIITGENAKSIFDSLNIKSLKYAELLSFLADAYGFIYNYDKSLVLQKEAAIIYEQCKEWGSLAAAYNNICHFYQMTEDLENAEIFIKKAIDVINNHDISDNSTNDDPFTIKTRRHWINNIKSSYYGTLAVLYQKKGNYSEAIDTELKRGKYVESIGDKQMYALHLMLLSDYYLGDNQFENAKNSVKQSADFIADDDIVYSVAFNTKLSVIYYKMGDIKNAIHYAQKSVSLSELLNLDINDETLITARCLLSFLYWTAQEIIYAEECLSKTLDLLINKICNEIVGMTNEQRQRIWSKYEVDFLLYRSIIEKSDRKESLSSKLYNYVLFSKSLLLDSEIQQKNNNISRLNIKWKDIQQQLSDDAIAIEFISTIEGIYHALVIDKKTSSPRMITLYSESKLFKDIVKKDSRHVREIVGELIWKPILNQYATVKDIYFSPDGILHMLPIEYYSADDTNSMFEHYNMYRLSSTKELIEKKYSRQHNSAVLYGGLDYNQQNNITLDHQSEMISSIMRSISERGGFDPLYNTLIETEEIKNLLNKNNMEVILFSGDNGTENSFRDLSCKNTRIIHLATHGMYIKPEEIDTKRNESNFGFLESLKNENDPVKEDVTLTHSFLVMSGGNKPIKRESNLNDENDGILTAKEISQLDLSGLDLLVLSACESAKGDITNGGVYGLQRGFKKAGANTILMSLDKVDDEATRILMVEFYRNLMNGKTKHQSLKEAQKHLREVENGKYNDPKYWASFVMLDGID